MANSAWQGVSGGGRVVQQVNTMYSAEAHGATAIPNDDTKPQITEGVEYMIQVIVPTSASNKLRIDVVFNYSHDNNNEVVTVALFRDTEADALALIQNYKSTEYGAVAVHFTHYMDAPDTSSHTFRVRAGGTSTGDLTFNGIDSARTGAGIMASSITITEIQPGISGSLLTAGTDPGNAVQLDADGKLPAVDGSALTNLPVIKAWCSFDGSGSGTLTALDSFNVTSIVKDATGTYTITWDTDFANAFYAVVAMPSTEGHGCSVVSKAAGSMQMYNNNGAGSKADSIINVIAIGD